MKHEQRDWGEGGEEEKLNPCSTVVDNCNAGECNDLVSENVRCRAVEETSRKMVCV